MCVPYNSRCTCTRTTLQSTRYTGGNRKTPRIFLPAAEIRGARTYKVMQQGKHAIGYSTGYVGSQLSTLIGSKLPEHRPATCVLTLLSPHVSLLLLLCYLYRTLVASRITIARVLSSRPPAGGKPTSHTASNACIHYYCITCRVLRPRYVATLSA